MILSATKKKITIHESQSLSRWTCQQQEDMAITFVSALQWWTPQDYQVQKQVSLKKVCFFWKLLKCIVSYMSSKWVNACFMSSQNSLLLAHVHLKEFILSNTVVFQLDISERARLISVYLFIYINIYIYIHIHTCWTHNMKISFGWRLRNDFTLIFHGKNRATKIVRRGSVREKPSSWWQHPGLEYNWTPGRKPTSRHILTLRNVSVRQKKPSYTINICDVCM